MHYRTATVDQKIMNTLFRYFIASMSVAVAASALAEPRGGLLRLDTDGDGQVSREEFRLPPPRRGESLFDRGDSNGDGTITRDELLMSLDEGEDARDERRRDRALERFDEMDADGNSVLTEEEARNAAFARLDENGDGFVTEDEARAAHEQRRKMHGRHAGAGAGSDAERPTDG